MAESKKLKEQTDEKTTVKEETSSAASTEEEDEAAAAVASQLEEEDGVSSSENKSDTKEKAASPESSDRDAQREADADKFGDSDSSYELSEAMSQSEMTNGTKTYKAGGYDDDLWNEIRDKVNEEGSYESDDIGGTITKNKNGTFHYEGYLAADKDGFDFYPEMFSITTKTIQSDAKQASGKIPVLRYTGFSNNGDMILIPKGVGKLDYTFEGTDIKSVPKVPEGVESIHCAFARCKDLKRACDSAKKGYNHGIAGHIGGTWYLPDSIEDASGAFYGDPELLEVPNQCPERLLNAQYMFGECIKIGTGKYLNSDFKETYTNGVMTFDHSMFMTEDNSNMAYDRANEDSVLAFDGDSDDSTKNFSDKNRRGKYVNADGTLQADRASEFSDVSAKYQEMSKAIANEAAIRNATGLNGISNDVTAASNDIASGSAYVKDGTVIYTDDAHKHTKSSGFSLEGLADRAGVSILEFGVTKLVTGSNVAAVAVTGIGQLTGILPKSLKPLLNGVIKLAGEDSKIGQALIKITEKLPDDEETTEKTDDSKNDLDTTAASTGDRMENGLKDQVQSMAGTNENSGTSRDLTEDEKAKVKDTLYKNGKGLVADNVILTIGNKTLDNAEFTQLNNMMNATVAGIAGNAAGDDGKLSDEERKVLATRYMDVFEGLESYHNGIKDASDTTYVNSPDNMKLAEAGLKNLDAETVKPMYESLKALEDEYGDILSDEQRKQLDGMSFAGSGVPSYSDYLNQETLGATPETQSEDDMYANAGLDDPLESESGSAPGSQPSDDMNIQSDKLLNFQDYTEQSNKETEKSGKKGRETTEYLESVAQSAEQTQSDAEANFEA